ncbi:MAG TPA: nicotinate-nicotinamide nucleotide adenylyltransferase [Candidatus Saccharimonadales bacterium]|nr:nicotinate-nicotinamide nucleotide adenylyltransferase [Candidatus Saccharimonadales bacterium]
MKRIGIYSGSFDPVHAGHISFALQAIKHARLDELYFLPERRPRYKQGVEHFGHRVAMLRRASKPYAKFQVLELEDISFTIERTLPKLQKRFQGARLVFLFGSDVVTSLPEWPKANNLLRCSEVVVGVREGQDLQGLAQTLNGWRDQPIAWHIFESFAADVSSNKVREALRKRSHVRGLLTSVARYANRNWLYISLGKN